MSLLLLLRSRDVDDAQDLNLVLVQRTKTIYAPTIFAEGEMELVLVQRTKTIYLPTVYNEPAISLPLVQRTKSIYEPTVRYEQPLALVLVQRTKTIYEPEVELNDDAQELLLALVQRTKTIYEPTVRFEAPLGLVLVQRTKTIYPPLLQLGDLAIYTGSLNDIVSQRLGEFYSAPGGNVGQLFNIWLADIGYTYQTVGVYVGQTDDEAVEDALVRFLGSGWVDP
jgi:hypothetical protein